MTMMNNGYDGYSMSIRAREAYENGEKPKSKWTKKEIIEHIKQSNPSIVSIVSKMSLLEIKNYFLYRSSWHQTSQMYNRTDFYSMMSPEEIAALRVEDLPEHKKEKDKEITSVVYRGSIQYLEWSGTRNYPRAKKVNLEDVVIEERGCFYIIRDSEGKELVRKKIGSRGTIVQKYEAKKVFVALGNGVGKNNRKSR